MDPIVHTTKPKKDSLPGFFEPKKQIKLNNSSTVKKLDGYSIHEAAIYENILSTEECERLIEFMNTSDNFEEVGVQGLKEGKDERIGSLRTSIWAPDIAEQLWIKLLHYLPVMECDKFTFTDWWQGLNLTVGESVYPFTYRPVAISPLLRFMQYGKGGQHYAHYDASFIYPNNKYRSLKSMVIYLTTNDGAATRFIEDGQDDIPEYDRNHDDWDREVKENEIKAKSEAIQGNVLVFDHRICHDVEKYMGDDPRIIIRGDIIYKRR